MLAGFYGTVLCRILREGEHERFALIEDVDLLALPFGEGIRLAQRVEGHAGADGQQYDREQAYLPERRLDVS